MHINLNKITFFNCTYFQIQITITFGIGFLNLAHLLMNFFNSNFILIYQRQKFPRIFSTIYKLFLTSFFIFSQTWHVEEGKSIPASSAMTYWWPSLSSTFFRILGMKKKKKKSKNRILFASIFNIPQLHFNIFVAISFSLILINSKAFQ